MEVILQDVEKIIIPDRRHRKTFVEEDLNNLADSIKSRGLFHAPIVLADGVTLVAGERRLLAIKLLLESKAEFSYNGDVVKPGQIPVVKITARTKTDIREAELSENIDRVNLSWREKSAAVGELHSIREEEKQELGEGKQTRKETTQELHPEILDERDLKTKINDVSKDLLVEQYLHDPDVAKAKSRADAIKIITKKLEAKKREALGKEYDISASAGKHSIILGDIFEEMPKLLKNEINCIITDPPYGIDADTFTNQAASKHKYRDDAEYGNAMGQFILEQGFELTKKKAHLYMFMDINKFLFWKEIGEKAGWYVWNRPLIWYKGVNSGIAPRPRHGPRNTYEAIMYCIKGDKEINIMGCVDVIDVPHERGIDYAAHKPAKLYDVLIERSCDAGDYVLDPACGSGPIFAAAVKRNVVATGIDNNEVAISHCYDRLK